LLTELVDLLYPKFPRCPVCGSEFEPFEVNLCSTCIAKINFIYDDYCQQCGKLVAEDKELCLDCQQYDRLFDQARAVGTYDGGLEEYIKAFKYQGQRHLAQSLAQLMFVYLNRFYNLQDLDLITYIPVHYHRLQQRGFNQAYLLAKELAEHTNLELATLLSRIEETTKQSKLSKYERMNNLEGQFAVINSQKIADKTILIVDDVYTTGATVNRATKILLDNRATNVKVMTLASGKDLNLNKEIDKL
jgi:ComF family protein